MPSADMGEAVSRLRARVPCALCALRARARAPCIAPVALALALLPSAAVAAVPEPPQVLFGDLFVAVQTSGIFSDSKVFPDAIPRTAPARILGDYRATHPETSESLREFVASHFELPAPAASAASPPAGVALGPHIDRLWGALTRSAVTVPPYGSLLPLPRPYVVPGGRFREIYYWDSYFTMLGLKASGRGDRVQDMVGDFAYLLDTYRHIPNGTRSYYLSRSQPPLFFAMLDLLSDGDAAPVDARFLRQLQCEYAFWMDGAAGLHPGQATRRVVSMPDGSLLNRYWDDRDTPRDEAYREDLALAQDSGRPPAEVYRDIRAAAESGWDFSSRWFEDGRTRARIDTTQLIPVDLNSLLFGLEQAISAGCGARDDRACALDFARRAARRRAAIDRYLWQADAGEYLDYRWTQRQSVRRVSAATLYPLFTGLASQSQAAAVALSAQRELLRPGGIVTTPIDTGQQWDAPNGWAPLQWIAIAGLRRYGQHSLAATIACRWIGNVQQAYERTGKLVEKYDVESSGRAGGGGEYPAQDGFGWTNGVTRRLMEMYPRSCAQG
jgi:alpha,alpha-trehalase